MLTLNLLLAKALPISLEADEFYLGFYYGLMLISIAYNLFIKAAFRDYELVINC